MGGRGSGDRPDFIKSALRDGARKAVYDIRADVMESVFDEIPRSLDAIIQEAAQNITAKYALMANQEPSTLNREAFTPQADPGTALAAQSTALIDGKATFRGQATRSRSVTGVYNEYAMFGAINTAALDMVPDRSLTETLTVWVHTKAWETSSESEHMRARDVVRKLIIHGRTGRVGALDPETRSPWRLWRAMEHGDIAGKYRRVWARSVVSFTPLNSDEAQGDVVDVYPDSLQYGKWVVFMSSRWKWWENWANTDDNSIVVDDAPSVGGSFPIGEAVVTGIPKLAANIGNRIGSRAKA